MTHEQSVMSTLFDPDFSQSPRNEMYRAHVFPDLYPDEPQPVLSNWSDEDLEAYCGIYTAERRWDIQEGSA